MILKEYVAPVLEGAERYKEAGAYYDGDVAEVFSTASLRQALRASGHRGQHNYCRVVVDAVLNRLEIANIVCDSDEATNKITQVWDNNELDLEANEIHRKTLVYGDTYALVWPDENGELLISYNSPRTTAIVYDPENPRKKLYAVKIWKDGHGLDGQPVKTRLNIYTDEAIYKYVADAGEVTEGTNWTQTGKEDNPFGEIPVFHFRTHRPYGQPEHYGAYGAQNDINKLLATHFYTIDFQGAPQRYALAFNGTEDVIDFDDGNTDRENLKGLHNDPGSLWYLKGMTSVGQFDPADPEVFWKPIKALKESLAALTDTPFHNLERAVNVPSGEALRVAEAPLMKKVADRQLSFGTTWKELFTFILKVEGIVSRVAVEWADVESFDSLDKWDVMLKKINAGLSHRQALREGGYEEKEIEKIMAERDQEAASGAYYTRKPEARVSTDDNETFENRNGLTEQAKDNGGRGE